MRAQSTNMTQVRPSRTGNESPGVPPPREITFFPVARERRVVAAAPPEEWEHHSVLDGLCVRSTRVLLILQEKPE